MTDPRLFAIWVWTARDVEERIRDVIGRRHDDFDAVGLSDAARSEADRLIARGMVETSNGPNDSPAPAWRERVRG